MSKLSFIHADIMKQAYEIPNAGSYLFSPETLESICPDCACEYTYLIKAHQFMCQHCGKVFPDYKDFLA